jgi:hypothetical protein
MATPVRARRARPRVAEAPPHSGAAPVQHSTCPLAGAFTVSGAAACELSLTAHMPHPRTPHPPLAAGDASPTKWCCSAGLAWSLPLGEASAGAERGDGRVEAASTPARLQLDMRSDAGAIAYAGELQLCSASAQGRDSSRRFYAIPYRVRRPVGNSSRRAVCGGAGGKASSAATSRLIFSLSADRCAAADSSAPKAARGALWTSRG